MRVSVSMDYEEFVRNCPNTYLIGSNDNPDQNWRGIVDKKEDVLDYEEDITNDILKWTLKGREYAQLMLDLKEENKLSTMKIFITSSYQLKRRRISFFDRVSKLFSKSKNKNFGTWEDVYIYLNEVLPVYHCSKYVTNKDYIIATKQEILWTNMNDWKIENKADMRLAKKMDGVKYNAATDTIKFTEELSNLSLLNMFQGDEYYYRAGYLGNIPMVLKILMPLGDFVICETKNGSHKLYKATELQRMGKMNGGNNDGFQFI